jgi:hypothetical protein
MAPTARSMQTDGELPLGGGALKEVARASSPA